MAHLHSHMNRRKPLTAHFLNSHEEITRFIQVFFSVILLLGVYVKIKMSFSRYLHTEICSGQAVRFEAFSETIVEFNLTSVSQFPHVTVFNWPWPSWYSNCSFSWTFWDSEEMNDINWGNQIIWMYYFSPRNTYVMREFPWDDYCDIRSVLLKSKKTM